MGEGVQLLGLISVATVVYTICAIVYGLARLAVTEAPAIVALLFAFTIAVVVMYTQ